MCVRNAHVKRKFAKYDRSFSKANFARKWHGDYFSSLQDIPLDLSFLLRRVTEISR